MEPRKTDANVRRPRRVVARGTTKSSEATPAKSVQRRNQQPSNPTYRTKEAAAETARNKYYEDNPEKIVAVKRSIGNAEIEKAAESIAVTNILSGTDVMILGISVIATSKLIGKTYKTLRSWIDKGIVPPPIHASIDRPDFRYYTPKEVAALVNVLKQADTRYLKASNAIVEQLFQAIEGSRL